MQIATHIKTGRAVQVLGVNRGWVKIRQHDKKELSVRSSEIKDVRESEELPTKVIKEKKEIDINSRRNGVVDSLYLPQYQSSRVTRKDGTVKRALDCGDEIASKMRGMDIDDVYKFAADICKTTEETLWTKFKHLNVGMQRMNLGNMVRKALKGAQ